MLGEPTNRKVKFYKLTFNFTQIKVSTIALTNSCLFFPHKSNSLNLVSLHVFPLVICAPLAVAPCSLRTTTSRTEVQRVNMFCFVFFHLCFICEIWFYSYLREYVSLFFCQNKIFVFLDSLF